MYQRRPIKLLIFDNNGTMLDDLHLAYACSEAMFSLMRVPAQPKERFRRESANDVSAFCQRHGAPSTVTHEQLDVVRKLYYSARIDQVRMRSGLTEALICCAKKDVRTAVCSAEDRIVLDAVLERFRLTDHFQLVRGEARPKAPALLEIVEHFGFAPHQAAYLDDTVDGLRSAREAGLHPIAFAHPTAYSFAEHLWECRPDYVVSDFVQLRVLITTLAS